jgi:hypothetical protein
MADLHLNLPLRLPRSPRLDLQPPLELELKRLVALRASRLTIILAPSLANSCVIGAVGGVTGRYSFAFTVMAVAVSAGSLLVL